MTGFNGGSTITSYKIYVNATGTFDEFHEQTNLLSLEYQLTSSKAGHTLTGNFYAFKVSAINAVGEGELSDEIVIIAALVPLAATSLTKVSANTEQITFSWVAAPEQGSPLLGYKVYWNNGSGTANTIIQSNYAVATQYSTTEYVADLTDGAEYRFKLVAFNAVGDGAVSAQVAIVAATVPNTPAAPSLLSQSDEAISIQWVASAPSENGGSPIIDYRVYYDSGLGGSFTLLAESTTPDLFYTLTTVEAGVSYRFKITAENIVGESL